MRFRSLSGSPAFAAALSFVLPGLGQLVSGHRLRALLFGVPAVLGYGAAAWLWFVEPGRLLGWGADYNWLGAFLVVDAFALVFHAAAIVDAYHVAGGVFRPATLTATRSRVVAAAVVAILVATTTGAYARVAYVDLEARDALASVFSSVPPSWATNAFTEPPATEIAAATPTPTDTLAPTDSPSPSPSDTLSPTGTPTTGPTATPKKGSKIPVYPLEPLPPSTGTATDWPDDGWLNVILVGSDAGVGRWSLRYDAMMLLTVKLSTGQAALYGIPRNVYNVPLAGESAKAFACHCFPYPNMLNSLYRYAMDHPKYFPGGNLRGFKALENAFGALTHVKIDGMIMVNLLGFVRLVDALGGVKVNVPTRLIDNAYRPEDNGPIEHLNISPGWHTFNGHMALAYARSRHMDSDYGRMRRQQLVLKSLRTTIGNVCKIIPKVDTVLGAIKGLFWTDLPISAAPRLIGIANVVTSASVGSYPLYPPTYPEFYTQDTVNKIRYKVAHGLDSVPAAGNTNAGSGIC